MSLSDLIAPLALDRFMSDYYGQRPLHIPAEATSHRKAPVGWSRMSELLEIRPHWTEAKIKLILNNRSIDPDMYMDEAHIIGGQLRRADPAKVEIFLAMGASLVANSVEDIAPEIRAVTSALSCALGGHAGANIYCSFQNIQAFASHCDPHEVFAVQCEGEKVWNIYQNRAASPIEPLQGENAQRIIDAAKGPLMMQVRLRRGDVLYIPRGYFHDALASSSASLHVTFAVMPLTGKLLFRLLEETAVSDEEFRKYLPDVRLDKGAVLTERLAVLADRIAEMAKTPRFAVEVGLRQRQLWDRPRVSQLPDRPLLAFYARTDTQAEISAEDQGYVLNVGGRRLPLRHLFDAAEWLLSRPAFSVQELFARYRYHNESELRELVHHLEGLRLLFPYKPEV